MSDFKMRDLLYLLPPAESQDRFLLTMTTVIFIHNQVFFNHDDEGLLSLMKKKTYNICNMFPYPELSTYFNPGHAFSLTLTKLSFCLKATKTSP